MTGVDYIIDDDYIGSNDYREYQRKLSDYQQQDLVREFKRMVTERADDIQRDASYHGDSYLSFDPKNLDIESI